MTPWTLVENRHFQIYSQGGEQPARAMLLSLERLRRFFEDAGLDLNDTPVVRLFAFRSENEYAAYRLHPATAAYYVGAENRDYIVLPALDATKFPMAAHEYTHLILHREGIKLPPWLAEGLAEFLSTIRIEERACRIGAEVRPHLETLRRNNWLPISDLLATSDVSSFENSRERSQLFYAQSWELVEMLMLSPDYAPRLRDFGAATIAGGTGAEAFQSVYGKALDAVARDARAWFQRRDSVKERVLAAVQVSGSPTQVSDVPVFNARLMLAELLLESGELDRAQNLYRELAGKTPENGNISAALAIIALRKGNRDSARQLWTRALAEHVDDPDLCYWYAVFADDAGFEEITIRAALEKAVTLRPDFDDARYQLALHENNRGDFEVALAHFRAMKIVAPPRRHAYWSAVAYALNELGRRDEALDAARKAGAYAANAEERATAAQLAYMAQTDVRVQFTRDADGNLKLVTTRAAHGSENWNPFIEPGDQIRRMQGQLRTIDCDDGKVRGVSIQNGTETLRLSIPDPLHVMMRNAPSQFTCGAQQGSFVQVEFAVSSASGASAQGTLRGMEFQ